MLFCRILSAAAATPRGQLQAIDLSVDSVQQLKDRQATTMRINNIAGVLKTSEDSTIVKRCRPDKVQTQLSKETGLKGHNTSSRPLFPR